MSRYPLFPLPVVLFPGALMPLHIFEPRYRVMLAHCAESNHRFVILPPGEASEPPAPGTIGTVARIRAIQPLADGRSNVVVSGEDRVTLVAIEPADQPYLVGAVEVLSDLPEVQVPAPAEVANLRALAERYSAALATIADTDREADFAADPAALTFQAAALVEWELPAKQQLLGVRSVRERVTRLLSALPGLVTDAERRAAVHRNAPTNGKGIHLP